jgi:hypothetical protein
VGAYVVGGRYDSVLTVLAVPVRGALSLSYVAIYDIGSLSVWTRENLGLITSGNKPLIHLSGISWGACGARKLCVYFSGRS